MTNKELYQLNENNIHFMVKQATVWKTKADDTSDIKWKMKCLHHVYLCKCHVARMIAENETLKGLNPSDKAEITEN